MLGGGGGGVGEPKYFRKGDTTNNAFAEGGWHQTPLPLVNPRCVAAAC
jgi:hypothetical protein